MLMKSCIRCHQPDTAVCTPEGDGYTVYCPCGQMVWSAGTQDDAIEEWNDLNYVPRCHHCRTGEGSSCTCPV